MGESLRLAFPFEGDFKVSQGFGGRRQFYQRWGLKGHNGIDFALPIGTPVLAVDAGRVVQMAFDEKGYGVYIKLRHEWGESLYAHLHNYRIWLGAPVTRGQEIGSSGSTGISSGPHLHFGLRVAPFNVNDGYRGYCDPAPHLTEAGVNMSERHNGAVVPAGTGEMDGMDVVGEEASALRGFGWYQKAALRTWNSSDDLLKDLAYLALSLDGEAGELGNKVKKIWRHGHALDVAQLIEEVGDVLWYLAVIAARLGVDFEEVAAGNIDKLLERYPEGFSQERSRNRKEGG